jgi:uncharacterized protein (DUF2267 family)
LSDLPGGSRLALEDWLVWQDELAHFRALTMGQLVRLLIRDYLTLVGRTCPGQQKAKEKGDDPNQFGSVRQHSPDDEHLAQRRAGAAGMAGSSSGLPRAAGVLHALRDRLPVDQAAALAAQLPMLVRGFYYEGWHPPGKPVKERHKEEFLAHIAAAFQDDPDVDPERVARAVFQVVSKHVTSGEIEGVKRSLPTEFRSLWA